MPSRISARPWLRMRQKLPRVETSQLLRNDLETNYFTLGVILRKAHRDREALRSFEKAGVITEALFGSDPHAPNFGPILPDIRIENESDLQLVWGSQCRSSWISQTRSLLPNCSRRVTRKRRLADIAGAIEPEAGEYYAGQVKSEKQIAQQKSDREESLRLLRQSRDFWKQLQRRNALGSD